MYDTVYIHVPFCTRKCAYCAFYSVADARADVRAAYIEQLREELTAADVLPLRSLYLGGGTPSSLPDAELADLLAMLRDLLPLTADAEFSIEANPDSLTMEKAAILQEQGVNRVTLGVQSFDAALRQAIGRGGHPATIVPAVEALRVAGIGNVGIDLIYGLPGQTLSAWRDELERVADLAPEHISAYELSIESGTPLALAPPAPPDDDTAIAMWEITAAVLGDRLGMARYEISNYAVPGRACRHNVDIWYGRPFLGLGPAASWFDGVQRWTNVADLNAWLAGGRPEPDPLEPADRAVEILLTGLRTVAGWDRARFRDRTGHDWDDLRPGALGALADEGLLELGPNYLRPTRRGLLLANAVARELW